MYISRSILVSIKSIRNQSFSSSAKNQFENHQNQNRIQRPNQNQSQQRNFQRFDSEQQQQHKKPKSYEENQWGK